MDWLHFVGKQFYTEQAFNKEAQEHGVSRRIDFRLLSKMRLGDTVVLATKEGSHSKIIGYFKFASITGIPDQIMDAVGLQYPESSGEETKTIERRSGWYTVGASIDVSAQEFNYTLLVDKLKKRSEISGVKQDILIGGKYFPLSANAKITLKDVPFRQGLREFDAVAFSNAVTAVMTDDRAVLASGMKKSVSLRGQFYVQDSDSYNIARKTKLQTLTLTKLFTFKSRRK